MTNCEHCVNGIAIWQCLDCKDDNEESKMCDDCINEHIEANPNQDLKRIILLL